MNKSKIEMLFENMLENFFPHRAFPELAVVEKVYEDAGKGKYCCDVELLEPGSLEKTGKLLKEVPLNPIWAGKNKQGIYCLPDTDIVVVVGFIKGNHAFPFVQSIWADQYEAFEHKKNEFVITDGEKTIIRMKDKKISHLVGDNTSFEIEDGKITAKADSIKLNDWEITK